MSDEATMVDRIANLMEPSSAPAPTPKAPPANDPVDAEAEEIEVLANEPDPDDPDLPTEPEPAFDGVELEVSGEQKKLTKAELKAALEEHGSLKQTAESIGLQRHALEQERQAVNAIRQLAPHVESIRAEGRMLGAHLQRLDQEIQSLRESDPVGAFQKREEYNALAQRFQQLGQMEQQVSGELQMHELQRLNAEVQAELPALLNALPQWRDPAKRSSDQAFVRDYMTRHGYSKEEVNLATKSRYVVTLLQAAKYEAITKARASKKVTAAPPMARAGAVSSPGAQTAVAKSEYRKAVNSANSKGNPHVAAKHIEKELERRLFKS